MSELSRLLELVKKIDEKVTTLLEKQEDYITEKEAAKYLGVSLKTMQNYLRSGRIPSTAYEINVIGNRMYLKSKLILSE